MKRTILPLVCILWKTVFTVNLEWMHTHLERIQQAATSKSCKAAFVNSARVLTTSVLTLQLRFNCTPYILYYTHVRRLCWPGYTRSFLCNFPLLRKFRTVYWCIVILEIIGFSRKCFATILASNLHSKSSYTSEHQYYLQLIPEPEFLCDHTFCSRKSRTRKSRTAFSFNPRIQADRPVRNWLSRILQLRHLFKTI